MSPAQNAQPPSSTSVVILKEVTKLFGRFAALRAVSAEFAAGKLYVVLGENGAGKSTLLRLVAGLAHPTRGELVVLGSRRVRDVHSRLGYMAHAPLLYDDMDALENLRYFAQLYGIAGEPCAEVVRMVGLDPTLARRVGQYSQGMRQRLSLARAILNDPELLLLDEPFSNVDIGSAREMVRLLGEMRDRGKTIFVVTHQPVLLDGVADQSIVLNAGQIIAHEPGIPSSYVAVEARP